MLGGCLFFAAVPSQAQVAEAAEPSWAQVEAPLNEVELNTYKEILESIDQGKPVPQNKLDWAKARINVYVVYVQAILTPVINQVIEDNIRKGIIKREGAPLAFEELVDKLEHDLRVTLAAMFQKAENR